MITGIYQILNTTDGKIYIGKAKDILCRWRNHRYQLKKGIHKNAHIQAAYNLDGVEAFLYSVVEECDVSVLEEREAFHIVRLNAVNAGYNLLAPLPSNHGVRYHSEHSRRKMSEAQLARGPLTEEHRERIRLNNAFTGKQRPPETIERMRQAQSGKVISDEQRQKLREANLGKKHSEETKRKMREAHERRRAEKLAQTTTETMEHQT